MEDDEVKPAGGRVNSKKHGINICDALVQCQASFDRRGSRKTAGLCY
jgi:hypothetical protein